MTSFFSKFSSGKHAEEVVYEPNLPTHFIDWPHGDKGILLQDLEVSLSVEELLQALFGNNAEVGVSFFWIFPFYAANQAHNTEPSPIKSWHSPCFVFKEACRKQQGSHDYIETEWMPSETDAKQAFNHKTAKHVSSKTMSGLALTSETTGPSDLTKHAEIQAGFCRMNMSNSTHLGRIVSLWGLCICSLHGRNQAMHMLR